jgi:hypothetical protein
LEPKPEIPCDYKHEEKASESVYFENTHSLALRACITDLFAYVISIPKEFGAEAGNTLDYNHEPQASESVYFENTHSLALRACITDLFAYVISIPKEFGAEAGNTVRLQAQSESE